MKRLNSPIISLILILFGLTIFGSVQAAPTNDPVSLLQYVADHMISGLRANKATLKSKPTVVYGLAYDFVVPNASLNEMSKRVLPPRIWQAASNSQRQEFQKLFTTTVIRTYASALSNYQDQTVKFFPVRGQTSGKTMIEVKSQIVSSQRSPIDVTYYLIRVAGAWKLYDMNLIYPDR